MKIEKEWKIYKILEHFGGSILRAYRNSNIHEFIFIYKNAVWPYILAFEDITLCIFKYHIWLFIKTYILKILLIFQKLNWSSISVLKKNVNIMLITEKKNYNLTTPIILSRPWKGFPVSSNIFKVFFFWKWPHTWLVNKVNQKNKEKNYISQKYYIKENTK